MVPLVALHAVVWSQILARRAKRNEKQQITPSCSAKASMPLFPNLSLLLAGRQPLSAALLHQGWVEQPSPSAHCTWCTLPRAHVLQEHLNSPVLWWTLNTHAWSRQQFPLTMLQFLGSTHWKCRATWRMASRRSATSSVCLMFLAFSASRSSSPRGARTARGKARKENQV